MVGPTTNAKLERERLQREQREREQREREQLQRLKELDPAALGWFLSPYSIHALRLDEDELRLP